MPGPDDGNGYRIVAGVDGSPSSVEALRWAVRQAELTGGTVDAVMAWQPPSAGGFAWGEVASDGGFASALLGSVSQHCTFHARCPVVVIR